MIRLLVDSSSDFSQAQCKALGIELIPLGLMLGGKSYLDGITLERNEFYRLMAQSQDFPKTAQPAPADFLRIFRDVQGKGDEMICITLSSKLSGAFQAAQLARRMAGEKGIYLIDSLSVATPIRMLVEYALVLRGKGFSAGQIVTALEELKGRIHLVAALNTLDYLSRGGRLPKSAALLGNTLHLKPLVTVEQGQVRTLEKQIGKVRASNALIQHLSRFPRDMGHPLYTIYSDDADNCMQLEKRLQAQGHLVSGRSQIGAAIGAHVGPGAFGIVYVKK